MTDAERLVERLRVELFNSYAPASSELSCDGLEQANAERLEAAATIQQQAARIAAMEREIKLLRRWRMEHDCRFTMGKVADISGSHCPLDKPCDRCQSEQASERIGELEGALEEIEDMTKRKQLPLSSMINDIARQALGR